MRQAWMHAGLKIGLGFLLVGAVLGVRIVTATPRGVEADIEALEAAAEAEAAPPTPAAAPSVAPAPRPEPEPVLSRLRAGLGAGPSEEEQRAREADRMVACRLNGGTQFMRAADCAMRGGSARIVESER